jgi:hypothetical protein
MFSHQSTIRVELQACYHSSCRQVLNELWRYTRNQSNDEFKTRTHNQGQRDSIYAINNENYKPYAMKKEQR